MDPLIGLPREALPAFLALSADGILRLDKMAARWFPRISHIACYCCLSGSVCSWHGITILRLDEIAARWFPRISHRHVGDLVSKLVRGFNRFYRFEFQMIL